MTPTGVGRLGKRPPSESAAAWLVPAARAGHPLQHLFTRTTSDTTLPRYYLTKHSIVVENKTRIFLDVLFQFSWGLRRPGPVVTVIVSLPWALGLGPTPLALRPCARQVP